MNTLNTFSQSSLGANLRAARKASAFSQRELADLASLSENYISQLENSHKAPSLSTLSVIAEILNTTPRDLMGDDPLLLELKKLVDSFGGKRVLSEALKMIPNEI